MHLDESVVVRRSAIDDDEDEVVVFVELGALVELFRVFDCERVKLEHIAEDLKVRVARSIEVEPEEAIVREQAVDRDTIEAGLAAALIVDDITDREAGAGPELCRSNSRCHRDPVQALAPMILLSRFLRLLGLGNQRHQVASPSDSPGTHPRTSAAACGIRGQ